MTEPEKTPEGKAVAARVLEAFRGGLRIELDSGARGWVRRCDLPVAMRVRPPADFVGTSIRGLVTGVDRAGRGVVVSPRHLAIARFQHAYDAGERLSGRVVETNRGGLVIAIEGHQAFAPRSELRRRENVDHWSLAGTPWSGWVLAVKSDATILSAHRPWRQRRRLRQRRRFLDALRIDDVRRGRVHMLTAHGAFIRLHRAGIHAFVPAGAVRAAERSGTIGIIREGRRVRVQITAIRPGGRHGEPAVRATFT